jgi:hypothetical protein
MQYNKINENAHKIKQLTKVSNKMIKEQKNTIIESEKQGIVL